MSVENPQAFPCLDDSGSGLSMRDPGMTLRDYFAGQALPYALRRDYGNDWGENGTRHIPLAAETAYRIADALLAERYSAQRKLPDGATCADCQHQNRCDGLFGAVRHGFTSCDFWPSRFRKAGA